MMYLDILNTYKEHYHNLSIDEQDDIKTSIKVVFDILPDIDLAMIVEDTQTNWTSKGNISTKGFKLATLYKRNGRYSRYKDGSGDIDPILYLLYNSGYIYPLNVAKSMLDDTTIIQTREISNMSDGVGRSRVKTFKLQ